MTAAENIRTYLNRRADCGQSVEDLGVVDICEGARLTEADLEVVVQMLDLLAKIVGQSSRTPSEMILGDIEERVR